MKYLWQSMLPSDGTNKFLIWLVEWGKVILIVTKSEKEQYIYLCYCLHDSKFCCHQTKSCYHPHWKPHCHYHQQACCHHPITCCHHHSKTCPEFLSINVYHTTEFLGIEFYEIYRIYRICILLSVIFIFKIAKHMKMKRTENSIQFKKWVSFSGYILIMLISLLRHLFLL